MHEDGAALSSHPRPVVVAEHEHDIVKVVGAFQSFGAPLRRKRDQPIVVAAGGIVTPAVVFADRAHRKLGPRPGAPVDPVQHLADGKAPEGRAAVAFAFQGADAGAAERSRAHAMGKDEASLASLSRGRPHRDWPSSPNPHDRTAFFCR